MKNRIRMCCLLGALVGLSGVAGENLVRNADFEQLDAKGRAVGWESLPSNFRVERSAGENGSVGLVYANSNPESYQLPGQQVKLTAGMEYRFSARVKTEGLNSNGHPGGANVCVEYVDANGKHLGGGYAHATRDTKGEWQTVECSSMKVKPGAVLAHIKPYVDRGFTGRAYFDSVRLERVDRKPVSGLWCSAYQSVAAEGEVTFAAGLELIAAGMRKEDCKAVFEYVAANGTTAKREAETFTDDEARLRLKVGDLRSGESRVGFSLTSRKTGKEIADSRFETTFRRVERLPERRVWIDARHRTIVDGKPFFPLGMYASRKLEAEDLARFEKSAFNCVMNYIPLERADMDAYAAHGLMFFYKLQDAYVGRGFTSEDAAERFVRDRVAKHKDHPGLLAWYVNDELGIDYVGQLRARRDLLQRLDPGHPTWSVIYQVGQMRHYMGTSDVIGTDPYPISAPGASISQVSDWTKGTIDGLFGLRPAWQVPQAFDWGGYWKGKASETRMPTRDEMANMGWQAIACGANGLVYYSYSDLKKMDAKLPFEKAWANMADAAAEIGRFAPVILLGEEAPRTSCANARIKVRAWKGEGKVYVLAVNATYEKQNAEIAVEGGYTRAKAGLGPQATVAGGKFKAEFPPLAVAMWRLSR